MKRIKKSILLTCLLCLCLINCGKEETAPEPIEKSQVYGEDFRVTIKSSQNWYKAKEFKKNCQFTMQLEYIGEEPEILIDHGDPLASIEIDDENGKPIIGARSIEMISIKETMKRGEPYELIFDAEDFKFMVEWLKEYKKIAEKENKKEIEEIFRVIKNETLKKGTYKAVAYIVFWTEDEEGNSGEEEEYRIKLPLTFEIR